MPRTEPFRSLAEVRAETARLRAERDQVQVGLAGHLDLVRDPAFRRALAGDAIGDLLKSWNPLRSVVSMVGNSPAAVTGALGLVLGAKARTPVGRVAMTALSVVAPLLIGKLGKDPAATGGKLVHELGTSWDHVKEYVRERRAALRERRSEP